MSLNWRKEFSDGLKFTAFHEFGHLLGADSASRFRSMHDGLIQCLNRTGVPFDRKFDSEVIADFWGAVALVEDLKAQSRLLSRELVDLVALNIAPLKKSSMFSPKHLPYGARQQLVLTEVCRHLRHQESSPNDCRLNLSN